LRLASQQVEAVEGVGQVLAGGGQQVGCFAFAASERPGCVAVSGAVAVEEEEDGLGFDLRIAGG
jgi:hypothetical protein